MVGLCKEYGSIKIIWPVPHLTGTCQNLHHRLYNSAMSSRTFHLLYSINVCHHANQSKTKHGILCYLNSTEMQVTDILLVSLEGRKNLTAKDPALTLPHNKTQIKHKYIITIFSHYLHTAWNFIIISHDLFHHRSCQQVSATYRLLPVPHDRTHLTFTQVFDMNTGSSEPDLK